MSSPCLAGNLLLTIFQLFCLGYAKVGEKKSRKKSAHLIYISLSSDYFPLTPTATLAFLFCNNVWTKATYVLTQNYRLELYVMMEMFYNPTAQYGSRQHVATKHLKCGWCD